MGTSASMHVRIRFSCYLARRLINDLVRSIIEDNDLFLLPVNVMCLSDDSHNHGNALDAFLLLRYLPCLWQARGLYAYS